MVGDRELDLMIRVIAKDVYSKEIAKARGQFVGLGKDVKRAFGAIGGIYAVTRGIRAMVRETTEWENATTKLNQVLKTNKNAVGHTTKALTDYAKQLETVTTFEDDVIVNTMAVLATFTKIKGTIFKDAIPAVMDLAATFDGDLGRAAIQLGKALNDPIIGLTALRRVGVSFSDEQTEMIKGLTESGNLFEAQTEILRELSFEMGGVAVAAVDTFGGSIKQLENVMKSWAQETGQALFIQELRLTEVFRFWTMVLSKQRQAAQGVGDYRNTTLAGLKADLVIVNRELDNALIRLDVIRQGGLSGMEAKPGKFKQFQAGMNVREKAGEKEIGAIKNFGDLLRFILNPAAIARAAGGFAGAGAAVQARPGALRDVAIARIAKAEKERMIVERELAVVVEETTSTIRVLKEEELKFIDEYASAIEESFIKRTTQATEVILTYGHTIEDFILRARAGEEIAKGEFVEAIGMVTADFVEQFTVAFFMEKAREQIRLTAETRAMTILIGGASQAAAILAGGGAAAAAGAGGAGAGAAAGGAAGGVVGAVGGALLGWGIGALIRLFTKNVDNTEEAAENTKQIADAVGRDIPGVFVPIGGSWHDPFSTGESVPRTEERPLLG